MPQQVRFLIATDGEDRQWEGYLARLTPDSLYVAIRGPDTIAVFARSVVRSVEHERRVSPGRAAGIGCGAVGAALGALGYFGTHDPDSPGIEKPVGVLSAVVGCAFGAVGGLVVPAVRSHGWEPWILPDSIGSPMPRNGTEGDVIEVQNSQMMCSVLGRVGNQSTTIVYRHDDYCLERV